MPVQAIARGEEQLVTTSPSTPAAKVADIMEDHSVGSVIVTEDGKPVGIVTDRDIALSIAQEGRDHDTPVSEFMTRDPITASESQGVMELCRTMREHSVRRMPVTDDDGTLVGIVTLDDLVVLLQDEMENLSGVIRSESPPY